MKIRKRYFLYSIFFFTISSLFGVIFFKLIENTNDYFKNVKDLTEKVNDISINFSLTMLGFLIAAFSLLQLVQTKEWYEKISKSLPFQSFLKRLWIAIIFVIINFIISVICVFLIKSLSDKCLVYMCCFLLGILGYNISWIFACMVTYIQIVI